MSIKILVLLLCICYIASIGVQAQSNRKRSKKLPPCHFKAVENCVEPLYYFSHRPNTTGLAVNRREHALLCRTLRNVTQCVDTYFADCGTQVFKEVFDLVSEVYTNTIRSFCRNGDLKSNYLNHARCLNDKVRLSSDFKKNCVSNFQATLESVDLYAPTEVKVNSACCAYRSYLQCSLSMVSERCEPKEEAETAYYDYFNTFMGGLPNFFCKSRKYDPSSKVCQGLLNSPKGKAKGKKSNSVLSKYYSLFFPNLGY